MTPADLHNHMRTGVRLTHDLMQKARQVCTVTPTNSDLDMTLHELFMRGLVTVRSSIKLDETADVQLLAAAARSIFETAVDITLVFHDQTGDAVDRMLVWESSAKLKHARCFQGYYASLGLPLPNEWRELGVYVARKAPSIKLDRARLWPDRKKKGK